MELKNWVFGILILVAINQYKGWILFPGSETLSNSLAIRETLYSQEHELTTPGVDIFVLHDMINESV